MSDLDPTVAWDVAGAIAKLLAVDPEDGTTVIGIAHEPNGGVIPVWGFHEGYAMRLAETAITALTEAGWSPPAADDDEEVEPSVETIDADTIRGMAAIEQIRCRDVSAEIELDEDEPSVESLLDEADLMMWPAHHEPDELVRARFRSIVHGAIAKLGEVSEEAGKLRAEVEQLREAVAPQTGEISREKLLQRSKRVLVDCVLAQIPQVRFLQQELGKAGMEIAKAWEEANQANDQRDDYGRELAEFRRLHLEHLARCNQEAHGESLLNIWDMVKKAEAERDLLRVQLHDAHERIALALVACKDLEPYALPGDALQLARKVVGILARDGGVDGPRTAVTASVGLERCGGTSGAQASAEGDVVPPGCGNPECTAKYAPIRIERHTSECSQKRLAAEIAASFADEEWAYEQEKGDGNAR